MLGIIILLIVTASICVGFNWPHIRAWFSNEQHIISEVTKGI